MKPQKGQPRVKSTSHPMALGSWTRGAHGSGHCIPAARVKGQSRDQARRWTYSQGPCECPPAEACVTGGSRCMEEPPSFQNLLSHNVSPGLCFSLMLSCSPFSETQPRGLSSFQDLLSSPCAGPCGGCWVSSSWFFSALSFHLDLPFWQDTIPLWGLSAKS